MVVRLLAALLLLTLSLATATAGASDASPPLVDTVEGRRVSITGTVDSVAADHFTLKDLGRRIVVEMDGRPWNAERMLAVGDRVAVSGRTVGTVAGILRIRASALMIPKLNYPGAPDDDWLALNGTVSAIAGDRLTLDSGGRRIVVDASDLGDGDLGGGDLGGGASLPLHVGERVTISGVAPDAFLAHRQGLRAVAIARFEAAAPPVPSK